MPQTARRQDASSTASIDAECFRDALANLASGVTLISCWDNGAPKGLLATSLSGLSVQPPRLLFSVRHEASAHDALLREGRYSATILGEGDKSIAQAFASSAGAASRFSSNRWDFTDPAAPRLEGGLASFELRTEQWLRSNAATIFIAEVLSVRRCDGAPLLYFDRSFAGLTYPETFPQITR